MTSTLITNTVQALIAHHADDAGRVAVVRTVTDSEKVKVPVVFSH